VSLIPTFQIGLWNAWIFMLQPVVTTVIFLRIAIKKDLPSPDMGTADSSLTEKIVTYASKLILLPALIYSIFLPLKLGTMWFYIGLPVTLVGIIAGAVVLVNWAATPNDKPVTSGLYRYSRHPMYVSEFVFFLGLAIATASWLFLLIGIFFTIVSVASAKEEEQITREKYGDTYREYINRAPKWIGIPKSEGN